MGMQGKERRTGCRCFFTVVRKLVHSAYVVGEVQPKLVVEYVSGFYLHLVQQMSLWGLVCLPTFREILYSSTSGFRCLKGVFAVVVSISI